MTKVVYSACYGGFGLSALAVNRGRELSGNPKWGGNEIPRHDPVLVQVVEELGDEASGEYADLTIAEVEGKYRIEEYDGLESVHTPESYDWVQP